MGLVATTMVLSALSTSLGLQATKPPARQTLYYVPHTHWEGAVFKTREEYLQMGLPNILKAVHLLKKYPAYRFTLDQVAYVKPFLERYPEEAASFRQFVKEGRLEIAGGMDVMPDDVKPGGELFVRQMQYGKRWCKEALGVDVPVAWMLDTFGHHPQLPQLLRQAGYTSFWFCRGVPKDDIPSEFLWRGIDGSTIPAVWLPGFYGLFYGPPDRQDQFDKFFRDRFHALDSHVRAPERVGLAGVDVSEPEDHVMPLLHAFNQRAGRTFDIRPSIPSDFASVVLKRKDLPTFDYDLGPIFQGTFSSRIELKQATREVERKLLDAEKLGVMASVLGSPSNADELWPAWEPVLFNQTHDLASGVMTDHVYEDVKRGYDFADKAADDWTGARLDELARMLDTTGPGIPVVVFNTLGFSRTDVVEVDLGFAGQSGRGVSVVDPNGQPVPCQIVEADRYEDGALKRARVAFEAWNVPPLGCRVYHAAAVPSEESVAVPAGDRVENSSLSLKVDLKTGAIVSLLDKAAGAELLSAPANVVSREQDRGDLWELYHGLDGASHIAMTNRQPVPARGRALFSADSGAKDGTAVRGPVYTEFSVRHGFGNGEFATRIRLYNLPMRIDIHTEMVNDEKFVRYQALFPTSIRQGKYTQEIPFGSVERPEGVENAAQTWVDWSDGKRGLAILNAGMPGNLVTDGTMMLSLLRSHNVGGYGFGGGYEPGMSSDTGFELGVRRSFDYAILPHAGKWQDAGICRAGQAFNTPLIARKAEPHAGFRKEWALLNLSNPNVLITSVRRRSDGLVALRLYETAGVPQRQVELAFNTRLLSANESDLLEKRGKPMKIERSGIRFDLHPFEIKTILLKLAKAQ